MTTLIETTVLQNTDGRSAQYEVHVIEDSGKYSVVTRWGSIGARLQSNVIAQRRIGHRQATSK